MATTSRRLVRIIREGIYSLFKAIKIILFTPPNLTPQEAWHEAKKLIVSGFIVGVGIFVEEAIEKFLLSVPIIVPFANVVTNIFVGTLTGIAIAMAMYWLDEMGKSKSQLRYEAISRLVAEKLPAIIKEREELELLIDENHKSRLEIIELSLSGFEEAVSSRNKKGTFKVLNKIHKLQKGRELEVKDIKDVRAILEQPNRTGKLKW